MQIIMSGTMGCGPLDPQLHLRINNCLPYYSERESSVLGTMVFSYLALCHFTLWMHIRGQCRTQMTLMVSDQLLVIPKVARQLQITMHPRGSAMESTPNA